jgi:DNA polymerase I
MAYIDWDQQEFGIIAVLSRDPAMLQGYLSGDPYIAFGRAIGMIPSWGTKATHSAAREICKVCILGTLYGMTDRTLARRIGKSQHTGMQLMSQHKCTYHTFWRWCQETVRRAKEHRKIQTALGWQLHWPRRQPVDCKPITPRTIQNFPAQAHGAELLRLAVIYAVEAGVRVCAPLHDALLIEAPREDLDEAIHRTQQAMQKASDIVLHGFPLRTDPHIFTHPDHYEDKRGIPMWHTVQPLLGQINLTAPTHV